MRGVPADGQAADGGGQVPTAQVPGTVDVCGGHASEGGEMVNTSTVDARSTTQDPIDKHDKHEHDEKHEKQHENKANRSLLDFESKPRKHEHGNDENEEHEETHTHETSKHSPELHGHHEHGHNEDKNKNKQSEAMGKQNTSRPVSKILDGMENYIARIRERLPILRNAMEVCIQHSKEASSTLVMKEEDEMVQVLKHEMHAMETRTRAVSVAVLGEAADGRYLHAERAEARLQQARFHEISRELGNLETMETEALVALTMALDIQSTKAKVGVADRRDKPITAKLNPHATLHDAQQRFNGTDSEMEPPEELKSDPSDRLFNVQWDCEQDDEIDVESGPPEPFFPHVDPMMQVGEATGDTPLYQSMAATLVIEDADGTTSPLTAVVDSGAAWSAMSLATCKRHYPQHYALMQKTKRRFIDASGNLMPPKGVINLTIHLGECRMTSSVFVFAKLGASMLLGTNTLVSHGLVINAHRRLLYTDPDVAKGLSCEVPLEVTVQPARSTAGMAAVGIPSEVPETAATHPGCTPVQCSACPMESTERTCLCSSAFTMHCDRTSKCVTVKRAHSPDTIGVIRCREYKVPLAEIHHLSNEDEWTSSLTVDHDVHVPAGARGRTVLLSFTDHITDALAVLEITPTQEFHEMFPNLRTLDAWCWSAMNFNSLMHTANDGEELVIPKGTVVATARRYHPSPGVTSAQLSIDSPETDGGQHGFSTLKWCLPDDTVAFEDGGPPTTDAHMLQLGLDLSKSIDPNRQRTDGSYEPLSTEQREKLYGIAKRWWWVWSRDARAPELSRLIVLDIPTGDAPPIAQRPYPIPYKYRDAVIDELQKLLESGLIEPSISPWASPILVRLKKDSTPDQIRLKIIVDFRRLNQCTLLDSGGLGDMEEILDGFGGRQRFCGIADAAGGFYQYSIKPTDRLKTAFVLPTSMGGTSFQWRVAPYGLTRNPAGYSRGMMYALAGLHTVHLLGDSVGGSRSWIDDISMHADSFEGFADLFERILMRMATASMQLKASKCLLLHEKLEVLGFYVTPDGLIMQDHKLKELEKRDVNGQLVAPSSKAEIQTFLGAVQFYRRFIPRISLLAAPMVEMTKAKPDPKKASWEGVRQSFEAIIGFLRSDAVVSAPDLSDPLAEYVICTDACDVAAGGVLLQWQHPSGKGPGPPPSVPVRGGKGGDPLTQSWRLEKGWRLRTIAFYSKTFDVAQKNYPTFDKESAAILFCIRRWSKLITCNPTTVYTDSVVAASMLYKHMGPPRLQRWGMELGTFLPFLKVGYRKGSDNGMADFLSRYPAYRDYVAEPKDVQVMSEELFDALPESVPMFTHRLGDDEGWLKSARYELYEAKDPQRLRDIWQAPADDTGATTDQPTSDFPSIASMFEEAKEATLLPQRIEALRKVVSDEDFWTEQKDFDDYCQYWERHSSMFEATHGRAPVIYDLCCGEGGFSRGARMTGAKCFGFDLNAAHAKRYEQEHGTIGASPMGSGMKFTRLDVTAATFWDEMEAEGKFGDLPRPDFIHISPPCKDHSRLGKVKSRGDRTPEVSIDWAIRQLKRVEKAMLARDGLPLMWQVENVPESEASVSESVTGIARLCGTMMGHRVFRHRVFYCNYKAVDALPHHHSGKWVGSRGLHYSADNDFKRFGHLPPPNMYGVYSQPSGGRGSLSEWHGALGYAPHTFSTKGIVGALPISYGRLLCAQMAAHHMSRMFYSPIVNPHDSDSPTSALLDEWAVTGYSPPRWAAPRAEPKPARKLATLLGKLSESDPLPEPETTTTPELQTEDEGGAAYDVTRQEQLRDPHLNWILKRLELPKTAALIRAQLLRTWIVKAGRLWRIGVSEDGEEQDKLAVPSQGRGPLLRRFHMLCHRGHEPLYHAVSVGYYWPNMLGDCVDFVNSCVICAGVKSRNLTKAPIHPVPTPARPFNVIHVDHKGPLPRSGPYVHIMVITCALTRFTLYIPVPNVTADETVKQLMGRVFCVFGFPLTIVTDNGPAFRNGLQSAMSQFFGYRHVPILPYNAGANGTAEASVKRIKLLLDRHVKGYTEWHKILPLAQLQLNSHVHTSTKVSPFMALFGRPPTGIEFLENPELLPVKGTGTEWLLEVKNRLIRLHRELQAFSDKIKEARAAEANLRRLNEGSDRAGTISKGGWIRIIRGSEEDARYIRKHGHGHEWKTRYKVLDIGHHSVLLEVPKDGSVPAISEWQSIRRCEPAEPPERDQLPQPDDPKMTERGVPLPTTNTNETDQLEDDDTVYEIDRILKAEKIGNRYRLLVKWKGNYDPSPMWRSDLVNQTTNEDLLEEIEDAVQRCREELREANEIDDDPVVADKEEEVHVAEGGETDGRRARKMTSRYEPTWLLPELPAERIALLKLRTFHVP